LKKTDFVKYTERVFAENYIRARVVA